MLYSMTGYGIAEGTLEQSQCHVSIEIRSLNGRNFELSNNRFPSVLRPFEIQIRDFLKTFFVRGTIDVSIKLTKSGNKQMVVNKELAGYYYDSMKEIAAALSLEMPDATALQTIISLPEVVASDVVGIEESDWGELEKMIQSAAGQLKKYRKTEGATVEKDLLLRVGNIEHLLGEVAPLEKERIERIRLRINDTLTELVTKGHVDKNRFEQELIYYLEKIDFSEEKQRLAAHCRYFKDLVSKAGDHGAGKKLGFVLQEIGREINTLGSKANDAGIQMIVVNMKDELEKAKEQVLNVL